MHVPETNVTEEEDQKLGHFRRILASFVIADLIFIAAMVHTSSLLVMELVVGVCVCVRVCPCGPHTHTRVYLCVCLVCRCLGLWHDNSRAAWLGGSVLDTRGLAICSPLHLVCG